MPRAFSSGALSIWSNATCLRPAPQAEHLRDRRRQRGLAVIHVTDRADVHVRLVANELFLGHGDDLSNLLGWLLLGNAVWVG